MSEHSSTQAAPTDGLRRAKCVGDTMHVACVAFRWVLTHRMYEFEHPQHIGMIPRLPPPDFNEGAAQVRRLLDRDRRELMGEEEIGQVMSFTRRNCIPLALVHVAPVFHSLP